jgi:hypothetical protein
MSLLRPVLALVALAAATATTATADPSPASRARAVACDADACDASNREQRFRDAMDEMDRRLQAMLRPTVTICEPVLDEDDPERCTVRLDELDDRG